MFPSRYLSRPLSLFLFFSCRDSYPRRYDIKSDLSLEEPGVIGPPFNFTFQVRSDSPIPPEYLNALRLMVTVGIQNLGFFPVKDLQLNIEIPEMTKNGNQLLRIADFYIDQVGGVARAGSTSTIMFNVSLFEGPCTHSQHRQHILFRHLVYITL